MNIPESPCEQRQHQILFIFQHDSIFMSYWLSSTLRISSGFNKVHQTVLQDDTLHVSGCSAEIQLASAALFGHLSLLQCNIYQVWCVRLTHRGDSAVEREHDCESDQKWMAGFGKTSQFRYKHAALTA